MFVFVCLFVSKFFLSQKTEVKHLGIYIIFPFNQRLFVTLSQKDVYFSQVDMQKNVFSEAINFLFKEIKIRIKDPKVRKIR